MNYSKLNNLIKKYENIFIYSHLAPDGDAHGSQYGMYYLIKANFKNKNIKLVTKEKEVLSFFEYTPKRTTESKINFNEYLAIVVDTSSTKRIDGLNWNNANDLIVIDHHNSTLDSLQNFNKNSIMFIESKWPSNSIFITHIAITLKWKIDFKAAENLMIGSLTDSGNKIVRILENQANIEFEKLYNLVRIEKLVKKINSKSRKDLNLKKWVLENIIQEETFNYFIAEEKDLKKIDLKWSEFYKEVNSLNLYGSPKFSFVIVFYEKDMYKISFRSQSKIRVDKWAEKFMGGGHKWASGCFIKTKEIKEVLSMVKNV